jgi:hypothetical protein
MILSIMSAWVLTNNSIIAAAAEGQPQLRQKQQKRRQLQSTTTIRLALMDTTTNTEVMDLVDGATIALSALPSAGLNVNAIPVASGGPIITSIQFGYNGNVVFRNETKAPFAMCGDNGAGLFTHVPPPPRPFQQPCWGQSDRTRLL